MTVTDLTELYARRAADRARHPSTLRYSGPRQGLLTAAAMIAICDLPDANICIWNDGALVVFDYTGKQHAAGDVRVAAQALGMVVDERASETADGAAAVELRGQDLLDGILRVVRAEIPVPADWAVQ